jgi:hypothetical protein
MKFFSDIWQKIKRLFRKKKSKSTIEIYEEATAIIDKGINKEEILEKARNTEDETERKEILKPISDFENAKNILKVIEEQTEIGNETQIKKKRKRLYEFYELEAELGYLEEKLTLLNFQNSQIIQADYPDTSSIDRRVDSLTTLFDKNKSDDKIELSKISISAFDKSFQQLEKLLSDKSAIIKHKNRETEKQRQEKIYENKIDKELNRLETLINQSDFIGSKTLIKTLSHSIKPNYKKGIKKLNQSISKLNEKELQNFKKLEEELLKKQAEQAKIIKEQEEKRFAELKQKREQEAIQKKAEEEKLNAKANRLKALLSKRSNWRDFQRVLQENGITTFYHFTDFHNLKSIKEQNGLYSWHYADSNGIVINFPGGDTLSRDLDKRYGLHDFVRVSLCTDHPMQYRLEQRGRNLALLKVDIEVAYYENTIFCNINATDSSHKKGNHLEDLERIRFSATKRNFVSREDPDFKHHQAEVLVKTWIPLEHITNINAFA